MGDHLAGGDILHLELAQAGFPIHRQGEYVDRRAPAAQVVALVPFRDLGRGLVRVGQFEAVIEMFGRGICLPWI